MSAFKSSSSGDDLTYHLLVGGLVDFSVAGALQKVGPLQKQAMSMAQVWSAVAT